MMLATCIGLLVACAQSHVDHRTQILDGINSIPVLGTPGTMAVWGEDAFPIIAGKNKSQPVAAAATYNKGRFFAIAHGAYVGTESVFLQQVTKWVSQKEHPRIGPLKNNTKNWDKVDLLMWGQNMQLSTENEEKLLEWIANGGGVIASACPWGWAQVTGNNLQTDLSQNRVMAKLGMQYGGNYAKGNDGVFTIEEIADETHAGIALQQIKQGEKITSVGSGALQYAVQLSPTFRDKVNAVIESDGLVGPTKTSPVKTSDVRRRLFVTNFSSQWKEQIPQTVRAASGSDDFPGTVDVSVPRVTETISLDAATQGWQSTGLYLCPGEVMQLRVVGALQGWSVQIGCHKDKLWHKDKWTRWPDVTHRIALQDEIEIATPWGGLVYFEAGNGATDTVVELSGCIEAPLFDVNNTADWLAERNNPAPWAEIKGHHMILTVPSVAVRDLENPEDVAKFWDTVVRSHCELAGVEVPKRPERFVADRQISAGYMHSGYPIMTGVDVATPKKSELARVVDVKDLKKRGSWGHFHELGHNRQRGWWTFSGTGEVTCNLFSLHAGEVLCGIEPWENPWLQGQFAKAKKYLEDGANFAAWQKNPGVALVSYAQLQREFGWEPMTQVFTAYEAMAAHERPKDNQAKMDEWVRRMSFATNRDLRPFYQSWGMPLSIALLSDENISSLTVWLPSSL